MVLPSAKDANEREILFCTYAVASSNGKPSCGIGLLIKYDNVDDKIININKSGAIDSFIHNALFQRREEISEKEFLVKEVHTFKEQSDINKVSDVKGLWKGIYCRNDKGDSSLELGGLEIVLIYIYESGRVVLINEVNRKKEREVEGFLSFPKDSKFIKCNFEITKDKIYQLQLFLQLFESSKDFFLEGVFSGWTNDNKPFSTLIHFEKINYSPLAFDEANINFKTLIEELDDSSHPQFVSKHNDDFKTIFPEDTNLISFFKNNKKFFNTISECLPETYRKDAKNRESLEVTKRFEGKYFLVSLDNSLESLIKAPIEIKEDCSFIIHYKEFHLLGHAEYFKNSSGGYLYLFVSKKRFITIQNDVEDFIGTYCFALNSLLKDASNQNHYLIHEIEIATGVSIRINDDNIPQVKKEYLIPNDNDTFSQEVYDETKLGFYSDNFKNNLKGDKFDYSTFSRKVLMGHDGNIIIADSESVKRADIKRNVDYGEVYFNSFLYSIIYEKTKPVYEIYQFLYNSLLHGLKLDIVEEKLTLIFKKHNVSNEMQIGISVLASELRSDIMDLYKSTGIKKMKNIINESDSADVQTKNISNNVIAFINLLREVLDK